MNTYIFNDTILHHKEAISSPLITVQLTDTEGCGLNRRLVLEHDVSGRGIPRLCRISSRDACISKLEQSLLLNSMLQLLSHTGISSPAVNLHSGK